MLLSDQYRPLGHRRSPQIRQSTAARARRFIPRVKALEDRLLLNAGALDPTFGTGGKVITSVAGATGPVTSDVVIQPDGKIVTAGTAYNVNSGKTDFFLTRYNRDGSLDPTFGTGGTVVTGIADFDFFPKIALQADNQIVLVGTAYDLPSFNGHVAVVRYQNNGSLDAGFGNGGEVLTGYGGDDTANAVAVQANGKIVVVGSSTNLVTLNTDIAVARLNKDGRLDSSFGMGGEVLTDVGGFGTAQAVALRPNGTIVVGTQAPASDFTLMQYNRSGGLDTSFGVGGFVFSHFASDGSDDLLTGIALQPDGKVVAVGGEENFVTVTSNFLVARYERDGTLDASFGAGGHATTGFGGFDLASSVVLQPDGKIVAAGPDQGATIGFALVRYNPDGTLDTAFGVGGKVATDFGGFALNFGVALQPDGKIVTAGFAFDFATGDTVAALARYEGHDAPPAPYSTVASAAGSQIDSPLVPGMDLEAADMFFSANGKPRHHLGVM